MKSSLFLDGRWQRIGRPLAQLDSGITNTPWGVDPNDGIYGFVNGKMRKVGGRLMHVSSGQAGVWGVSRNYRIYNRRGISRRRKTGTRWTRVSGALMQIDSGPSGMVCGVNKNHYVYCRRGITRRRPTGNGWIRVPGRLAYISCGLYGHWGVNKQYRIYFRYGVKFGKPQGRRWRRIPGALVQIESGPDGAVWGVNMEGLVFTRRGVSQRNPIGSSWKAVGRKHLTTVSVGLGYVFGIDNIGKPYIGDVAKFLGRNGLPKKPSMFSQLFYIFLQEQIIY